MNSEITPNQKRNRALVAALAASLCSVPTLAQDYGPDGAARLGAAPTRGELELYVNGSPVLRGNMPFLVMDGAVMVPLRFVAENLGGAVDWNADQRKVTIDRGARDLEMKVGSTRAVMGGQPQTMRVGPVLRQGRVLVPLKEVARFFEATVQYNAQTRTAFITAPSGAGAGRSAASAQ